MLVRLGEIGFGGRIMKTPKRNVTVREKGVKTKGVHSNGVRREKRGHWLREEKKNRRIDI